MPDQKQEKSKWIEFKEDAFSSPFEMMKKTKKFNVISKCSDCKLGEIRWYPQWRNYCYMIGDLVFSDRCLMEMSQFITRLNKEHKKK